ncbi:UDP-N-acetylmuramoyl-tripeptide--D-alanyl-D-alanine ligase [Paenibacillus sp. FSL K6-3182]|uniref:UDP-N-acetylmuramoyl-tripeptide--D-alanyl-D- alanine ligase n=1 Tax=Paenibacillus sp. FSL K6-3182 TaxID=2921495 RepID=UPI0030D44B1F
MRRPIIAVTGSAGKTTTKEMLASILERNRKTFKSFQNGNDIWFTSQYSKQIDSSYKAVVLEFGMKKAGDIRRHCRLIKPSIGVITTIGRAHVGHFKRGIRGIPNAKSELIRGMKQTGLLFINKDDRYSKLLDLASFKGKILTIGIENHADYQANRIRYLKNGMSFNARLGKENAAFFIPGFGHFNVYNALFAIAVSHQLGCTIPQIKRGLKKYEQPYARLTVHRLPRNTILIDDSFNTKPELDAALDLLWKVGKRRKKIAVLGEIHDLGRHSKKIHFNVGKKLMEQSIDRLYTIGSHAKEIRKGAIQSELSKSKTNHFHSVSGLKRKLAQNMPIGSAILLKGSTGINQKVKLMHLAEWFIQQAHSR